MPETKICTGCTLPKPLSEFQKRSKKPGDYKGKCKECERPLKTAYMRELRKRNPEYAKYNPKYYKKWAEYSPEKKAELNKAAYSRHRRRGDEYLAKRRVLTSKFYHKDVEKSRDTMVAGYYRGKGLPDNLVKAHVAVTKLKRAINGKEKGKPGRKKTKRSRSTDK